MVEILQKENKILRETAKDVLIKDITSPKIKNIIKDMKQALKSQSDGVAIAAPQIGAPLRIFVVSGRIFDKNFDPEIKGVDRAQRSNPSSPDMAFINPKIIKLSKKKENMPEGCLSVRWLYGEVKRSTNATVKAYDEHGKIFTRGGGGLLAQIFQHETDHLDGTLFIDKAKNLVEVLPEKNVKK